MKVETVISKYWEIQSQNCLGESMPASCILVRSLITSAHNTRHKAWKIFTLQLWIEYIQHRNVTYLGVMLKEGRDCCGTGAQVMMDYTVCYELSVGSVWHKA